MVEVEHAGGPAHLESGAEHDIGHAAHNGMDDVLDFARIVLKVCVLHDDYVSSSRSKACLQSLGLAAVFLMPDDSGTVDGCVGTPK